MKKKIRFLNQLLIFGIIFMLYSCEKDLYDDALKEDGKSIIQNVNLDDIPIIKQSIEDKKSKNSLTSKENATLYLNSINPNSVKVLTQNSGLKTYTFSLNLEETNVMTNLVVQETSSGLEYYLIKYSSPNIEQWKSDVSNNIISQVTPTIDFQELDAPTNNSTQNRICSQVNTYWTCPSGMHHWGEQGLCTFYFEEWTFVTEYTDVYCGGTTSGTSSPVIGGGGSYSSTLAAPCKKITNQFTKYPALKQALIDLGLTTSQNHENGIFLDNSPNATIQTMTAPTTIGGTVPINMNPANKYTMIAHTHDISGSDGNGTFSIFTFLGDLGTVAQLIKNDHIDTDNFVFYLITADGTRYAMTVDWAASFAEYFDITTDPNNPNANYNVKKSMDQVELQNNYYSNKPSVGKITRNSNPNDDLIIFLKLMKDQGINMSLFEVDETFTTFTKVTLNSNGTVNRKGC